jgi:hypothetical protein
LIDDWPVDKPQRRYGYSLREAHAIRQQGRSRAMGDWKIELDALVKQTTAFASNVGDNIGRERPSPREMVQRIGAKPPDLSSPEREEIIKRVQSFRAHQQRLIKEREEYAASILLKMRSGIR